jgi:hypothetical protein
MQEEPMKVVRCIVSLVQSTRRPPLNNYPGWQAYFGSIITVLPQFLLEETSHIFRPLPKPRAEAISSIRERVKENSRTKTKENKQKKNNNNREKR